MIRSVLPDPIQVDGGTARSAARAELRKRIYHQEDDPLLLRALKWVLHRFDQLLSRTADVTPGGGLGVLLIVLLVIAAIAALRWRIGPLGRAARVSRAVFAADILDAQAHRRRADAHAAGGDYAEAVRERFRAVVRELEQRGFLDPRSGRTAAEAAREAGAVVPELARGLDDGARSFDEIWYGGRVATAADDRELRDLDAAAQHARPAVLV